MPKCDFNKVAIGKGVLKICSKFTGGHPCQSVISIKLLRHGCSPVNLLHIFRTPFPRNTFGWLLLQEQRLRFTLKVNSTFCFNVMLLIINMFFPADFGTENLTRVVQKKIENVISIAL